MFETEALSAMMNGCLNPSLDRLYGFDGIVKSLRSHIEELTAAGSLRLTEEDGTTDHSRTYFDGFASRRGQGACIAHRKAKRYLDVNGWAVPKPICDAIRR